MKNLLTILSLLLLMGCAAVVTPEGTYLEPLPFAVTVAPSVAIGIAPPVVVERIRPLPSVYYYPDRYIYSYGGLYYNYWGGAWYYGSAQSGPWYALPRKYYPPGVHRGPKGIPPGHRR